MSIKRLILTGLFFISLSIGLLLTGCDKKVGKVPVKVAVSACDTITFAKHIKPIVEANCQQSGCHGTTNPQFPLMTYSDVKDKAVAGKIKARVIDGVPSFMPPTGPLPQSQKALIQCWLENGMKE